MSPLKPTISASLASFVFALLLMCVPVSASAQVKAEGEVDVSASVLGQAVRKAFDSNDHSAISSLFGPSVELQLPNVSGIFSRKQSDMIVGQFLAIHQGLTYELDHEEVADDATLTIGRASRQFEAFRVCILSQQSNDFLQIKQLRIETLK